MCIRDRVSTQSTGGSIALYNFGAMAVFALVPTWTAVWCAIQGNYTAHREWMLRSFAVCFSVAVLLRLSFLWLLPLMTESLPAGLHHAYMTLVFLSWSLPILAVDLWLTLGAQKWRGGAPCGTARARKRD
eukprot:TRINITY_DN15032_c0_g1_i2.p2 TRINITY_DN15032_c0_g1~~TRINITY_DN15032_c0_g1_i2.p2  ORF type:complete len:130 (+),score=9.97 TRINITY_DN15032_c0_g1_i2:54-443(+)